MKDGKDQKLQGHAKQVGTVAAALLSGGAAVGKFILAVDDDVDPSNLGKVIAAACMRCDISLIDINRGQ